MSKITVPAKFVDDFNFYCQRAGIVGQEMQSLRNAVRANFDVVGPWVSECAEVYRFCDAIWGYLPKVEWCKGYLASLGWFPEDETIFMRCGNFALAKLCWQVKNNL